jgi:hypothetical protein
MIDFKAYIQKTNTFLKEHKTNSLSDYNEWFIYSINNGNKIIYNICMNTIKQNKTTEYKKDYIELYNNFIVLANDVVNFIDDHAKKTLNVSQYNEYNKDVVQMFYGDLKILEELYMEDSVFFDKTFNEIISLISMINEMDNT